MAQGKTDSRTDRDKAASVTEANQAAQDGVGGEGAPDPEHEVGRQALGSRLGSTDSVRRATEPLAPSSSDDDSESAATERYAKR